MTGSGTGLETEDNGAGDARAPDARTIAEALGGRSVVFVGLMGAGKTAIGRKLAASLGLPFADSDGAIEEAARMSVSEIFERYGEGEFRALETRVVARLMETGPQVVSTGGGAFMNEATRSAIRERGVSVWLKAELDVLLERVKRRDNRPLLKTGDPRAILSRLMAERHPIYALADITVETRDDKKEVIAAEVVSALAAHLRDRTVPASAVAPLEALS